MSSNVQLPTTGFEARVEPLETLATPPQQTMHSVENTSERLAVSVIIPVRNDPKNLELCLQALGRSDYADYEVIVVDDASTDNTAEVAQNHGVQLTRLTRRSGPATARNHGVQLAQFPYLFFVDADVCVEPETLGQVAKKFEENPGVDAFFGSYDSSPGAPNILSQYRNLLHHFVHQAGNKKAFSFWSGCGAIKKSVFLDLGGFDTGYSNASVEDIELGSRLRGGGYRVALVKDIQVKHMKRWTFWQMVQTDIRKRGIPWTLLLLRQGKIPNDLNLRHSQRLSALLAGILLVTLLLGSWYHPSMLLIPLVPLLGLLLIDLWTARKPIPKWARAVIGTGGLVAMAAAVTFTEIVQSLWQPWTIVALGCLLGIVFLNLRFYIFLSKAKYPLFAFVVMPLHVLYYLYSGLAFGTGLIVHLGRGRHRGQG